jgi:predicted acylesterase/phospholipase RssA
MAKQVPRTILFNHCWGVFEGGGVRGAALAGAYQAAVQGGMIFGRVAGTSAGSIVAALVAAGASPEFILSNLFEKEFATLVQPPSPVDRIFEKQPFILRMLRSVVPGVVGSVLDLALHSGLHSSAPIQNWVETLLKQVLRVQVPEVERRPVIFKDLPLPLHIVASDLTQCGPKIWSQEETPNDSVALAVRCSCSIPFFFQAVRIGTSVLVDGGLLSNLPCFVFSRLSDSEFRSILSRIVAFSLVGDVADMRQGTMSGLVEFGEQLAATIVGGAAIIQMGLQPNIYAIEIDTGQIKATDFYTVDRPKKESLRLAGYDKVADFIRNERQYVRNQPFAHAYKGFDEKLLLIVRGLQECQHSVWISGKSTYWLYFTFPSLLAACRRGVKVCVVTQQSNDKHEPYRRWLLEHLGASLHTLEAVPFEGFLFDAGQETGLALISSERGTVGEDFGYQEEDVKIYSTAFDRPVVESFWNLLQPWHTTAQQTITQTLPFHSCTEEELFSKLRTVPQYTNARFSLQSVEIKDSLLVLQTKVKEYRLVQINLLVIDV